MFSIGFGSHSKYEVGSNFKFICSELNSIGSISAPLIC